MHVVKLPPLQPKYVSMTYTLPVTMSSEWIIKKKAKEPEAIIFSGKSQIAKIKKNKAFDFKLIRYKDNQEWILSNIVDGRRRPFSYGVRKATINHSTHGDNKPKLSGEILIIREQLFEHKGKIYMLASHPTGKMWNDYVNSSTRYISRLDGFPYKTLSDVDHDDYMLRHKVKRLRGTPVGEAMGLALEQGGHRVRLDKELDEIALFIAAVSYLLYAAG
jgi:hypothetical protein